MLCPQYERCKEPLEKPLSLRKSIKTKLHRCFLIILVFGLSKLELSFITVRKRGCNAVYDGHVYTFERKKDSGVMYWQCKGKRTLQYKDRLYVWEDLKRAILHYSSTTETSLIVLLVDYSCIGS